MVCKQLWSDCNGDRICPTSFTWTRDIYIYYISNHPIVNWHGIALKNCHLVDACSIGKGSFRLLLVGWLTAGYQKSHAPKIQK